MIVDEKILNSLTRLFKLLSDANRLRIVFAIGKDKKSVSEIMNETSLSQTLVSFHLRPLRESGVLAAERKGAFIYYSVSDSVLIDLLTSLCGISPTGEVKNVVDFVWPPMQFMQNWLKGHS
jgi:DNA-binding transcriptional ArsR family regulator